MLKPGKLSPKNWRKNGSIPKPCMPRASFFTTREEEILTTAGTTFFTTAEYPRRADSAERGAVLIVAGGLVPGSVAAPIMPPTTSNAPAETAANLRCDRKDVTRKSLIVLPPRLQIRPGAQFGPYSPPAKRERREKVFLIPD